MRVNTSTAVTAGLPSVAMAPGGRFVVAWQHGPAATADIFFQRYNAAGAPQGFNLLANLNTAGAQLAPDAG